MKWQILQNDFIKEDMYGIDGFVTRMEKELRNKGLPLEGFKFLNSPSEMLDFTREIEKEVLQSPEGADLYVGFQTAEKYDIESKRYVKIKDSGVDVYGYGTGQPENDVSAGLTQWVNLPENKFAVENQWVLVTSSPTPIALLAWETSLDMFGKGGLSTPGKHFRGFVSDDDRVVSGVIKYLRGLLTNKSVSTSLDKVIQDLKFPIKKILTLSNNEEIDRFNMQEAAAKVALEKASELVLYDLSAASYLVSAYPQMNSKNYLKILNKDELRQFGRAYLETKLEALESQGLKAGAILPVDPGFAHLSEWVGNEQIDAVMIPSSMVNPGLMDRLKGFSLKTLIENTEVPIIVYENDDSVYIENSLSKVVTG